MVHHQPALGLTRDQWRVSISERMKPSANPTPPAITPEQLREARAALGWSSDRLAARSGTTSYGIIKYERLGRVASKRGQPRDFDALTSIRSALEAAGVEFIAENGGGAGVRMRKADV